MFPPLATNDLRDRSLRDAELGGERDLSRSTGIFVSNGGYDRVGKTRVSIAGSSKDRWRLCSPLCNCIIDVVLLTSEEQMIASDAAANVAMMEHFDRRRHLLPGLDCETDAVCIASSPLTITEGAVTGVFVNRTRPDPTGRRHVRRDRSVPINLFPESLGQRSHAVLYTSGLARTSTSRPKAGSEAP